MTKKNLNQFWLAGKIVIVATLLVAASVSALEQPEPVQKPWQMSDAEKTEWLETFNILAPGDMWKVTNEGNEFFIECVKPMQFYYYTPNAPPGSNHPRSLGQAPFRVTLRFSPLLTKAQWKDIQARNEEAESSHHALLRKFKINQMYDQFSLFGDDARQRADSYRVEASKLKYELSPQFFGLDFSVTAFQSWHYLFLVDTGDKAGVGEDCEEFLNRLRRLFGTYEPRYAENNWFAYNERNRTEPIYPEKNIRIIDGKD